MTRRSATALLMLILVAVPLHADFASIARAIDAERGVSRIWIPFLGMARLAVRVVVPEGVHDFQLVTFKGARAIDPRKLQNIIRTQAGAGFTPLVEAWSRRSQDWSFIYARPAARGNRLELIVLAHDGDETVLVRVDVDASKVARELQRKPREVAQVARR